MAKATTIYLNHRDGATHQLSGKRLAKLRREILAGRGGVEITELTLAGYEGYLGVNGEVEDFETLNTYFAQGS